MCIYQVRDLFLFFSGGGGRGKKIKEEEVVGYMIYARYYGVLDT